MLQMNGRFLVPRVTGMRLPECLQYDKALLATIFYASHTDKDTCQVLVESSAIFYASDTNNDIRKALLLRIIYKVRVEQTRRYSCAVGSLQSNRIATTVATRSPLASLITFGLQAKPIFVSTTHEVTTYERC